MPTSIMQKNYSNCPLKKRPVFIVKEGNYQKKFEIRKIKKYNFDTKIKFS